MELEYRCDDGDLLAFADLHMRRPAVDRMVRQWMVYGYACLVVLLGLTYFRLGPDEFAIVLVVLGPVWIAVWPTSLRWFYRNRVVAAARALNRLAGDGRVVLRLDEAGLTRLAPAGEPSPFAIDDVVETPERLFIYVDKERAFVIPHARVERGDIAAVAVAARQRTERPVHGNKSGS